jgi:hypothetical protein
MSAVEPKSLPEASGSRLPALRRPQRRPALAVAPLRDASTRSRGRRPHPRHCAQNTCHRNMDDNKLGVGDREEARFSVVGNMDLLDLQMQVDLKDL